MTAYPAYRLGGRGSLESMLLGAGLSWATIVVSYLILVSAFGNAKQIQMLIVLGGFVVRMLMLFGSLALISKTLDVELNQLVIWLMSFYMVLVVAEAWTLAAGQRGRRTPEA